MTDFGRMVIIWYFQEHDNVEENNKTPWVCVYGVPYALHWILGHITPSPEDVEGCASKIQWRAYSIHSHTRMGVLFLSRDVSFMLESSLSVTFSWETNLQ